MHMPLLKQIAWSALMVFGATLYGLLIMGIVRKVMARIQGRIGPPLWQPIIDLIRTATVRTAISHGPMYYLGPVFRNAGAVGLLLVIPIVVGVPRYENFSGTGDLLLAMYLMFFGSLGMALGAASSGQPHSPMGASRGLQQMTTYELPFVLSVVAIAASVGSFDFASIVHAQSGGVLNWNLFAHPFAGIAGFIALLGMNAYSPFDIIGAPQEIPAGPMTEYHAGYITLMGSGRAVFAIAKMVLFYNLFLGGAATLPEAIIKIFAIYLWTIIVGAVFPRFRTDQSMRFFLAWPTAAGVIAVVMVMWKG